MKARTKTTRWLLISFLVGLLTAAGLTVAYHHGVPTLAKAITTPARTVLQPRHETLIAATDGPHTLTHGIHWVVASSYSDSHTPDVTGSHSDSHSNAATGSGTGWNNHASGQTADTSGALQPQNHPPTAGTNHVPQAGSGDFAYQTYAPLGCEMPAGCGAVGDTGHVPPRTSGGLSALRTSPNSGNDAQSPPPNNNSPPANDSGQNPPGPNQQSDPPPASAPELDAATLAGAVTLLLGALAILRGRRPARASR
jgi:hypothetical protein